MRSKLSVLYAILIAFTGSSLRPSHSMKLKERSASAPIRSQVSCFHCICSFLQDGGWRMCVLMLEVEDVCLCFFPASMLDKYDGHLNADLMDT